MYNRAAFLGSMFSAFVCCTGLTLGIQIANAQIVLPLSIVQGPPLKEVSCSTFLQPYFDWANASTSNFVATTVVFNKSNNDSVENIVTYNTGNVRPNGFQLIGDLTQLSSDRFNILPNVNGGFILNGEQPFSIDRKTSVSISFAIDGTVSWVERSINTVRFTYKAICYSNNTAILLPPFDRNQAAGIIKFQKGTLEEIPIPR